MQRDTGKTHSRLFSTRSSPTAFYVFFLPISLGAAALLVNVPAPAHSVCADLASRAPAVRLRVALPPLGQTVLRLFNAERILLLRECVELMQAPGVCSWLDRKRGARTAAARVTKLVLRLIRRERCPRLFAFFCYQWILSWQTLRVSKCSWEWVACCADPPERKTCSLLSTRRFCCKLVANRATESGSSSVEEAPLIRIIATTTTKLYRRTPGKIYYWRISCDSAPLSRGMSPFNLRAERVARHHSSYAFRFFELLLRVNSTRAQLRWATTCATKMNLFISLRLARVGRRGNAAA